MQTGKCYEPPLRILMSERETDGSKESRNGKLKRIILIINRKLGACNETNPLIG
jgi:hypothetical protein